MPSFHEVRFPADISFKASGGPEFNTDIVALSNGCEKRNVSWENARARYELDYKEISKAQTNRILSFFMARQGRAYAFRFKDWNDFEAKSQIIGVCDGTKTQFQLVKNYGETETYKRRITKPVAGTLLLYVDSTLQSNGFSFDSTTGVINFSEAPGDGAELTASFEFDVPVRFNSDVLKAKTETHSRSSIEKLELIEVKI